MKVYLYSPETGLYQGQDFADPAPVMGPPHELPLGATTIAPPAYSTGDVPVFLAAEERWVLRHLVRLQDWRLFPARESRPVKREPLMRSPERHSGLHHYHSAQAEVKGDIA